MPLSSYEFRDTLVLHNSSIIRIMYILPQILIKFVQDVCKKLIGGREIYEILRR
jgi:hypothetical protein